MSADNVICVQKIKGIWWVWMDFASCERWYPSNDSNRAKFHKKKKAMKYAIKLLQEEFIVEYGIVVLKSR